MRLPSRVAVQSRAIVTLCEVWMRVLVSTFSSGFFDQHSAIGGYVTTVRASCRVE